MQWNIYNYARACLYIRAEKLLRKIIIFSIKSLKRTCTINICGGPLKQDIGAFMFLDATFFSVQLSIFLMICEKFFDLKLQTTSTQFIYLSNEIHNDIFSDSLLHKYLQFVIQVFTARRVIIYNFTCKYFFLYMTLNYI